MEISQQVRLARKATGYDQESIATLILSGRYLGFLPDHYAQRRSNMTPALPLTQQTQQSRACVQLGRALHRDPWYPTVQFGCCIDRGEKQLSANGRIMGADRAVHKAIDQKTGYALCDGLQSMQNLLPVGMIWQGGNGGCAQQGATLGQLKMHQR